MAESEPHDQELHEMNPAPSSQGLLAVPPDEANSRDNPDRSQSHHWFDTAKTVIVVALSFLIFHLLLAQHYPTYSKAYERKQIESLTKTKDPSETDLQAVISRIRLRPESLELLKLEQHKAAEEISMDIQSTYDWYHYKFLMTGAVLASFLGYLGIAAGKGERVDEKMRDAVRSETAFVGLGATTLIAIMSDIHIREVITNLQKLGIWSKFYAEGLTLGELGWESTLRAAPDADATGYISQLTSASIHVFTWLLYALFLFVGASMLIHAKDSQFESRKKLFFGLTSLTGFLFVMLSLAANDTSSSYTRDIPFTGKGWLYSSDGSMMIPILLWCLYTTLFAFLISWHTYRQANFYRKISKQSHPEAGK